MLKKILSISLIFTLILSSPVLAGKRPFTKIQEKSASVLLSQETPNVSLSVICNFKSLLSNFEKEDQILKQTWSYKALAHLTPVVETVLFDSNASGPWGVLGKIGLTLCRYEATSLLTMPAKFLPSFAQAAYLSFVNHTFAILQINDIGKNPSGYMMSYASGAIGTYIISHLLPNFSDTIKQEIKGVCYFLFKKAGFILNDSWDQIVDEFFRILPDSLSSFILPQSTTDPLEEDIGVDTALELLTEGCSPVVNPSLIPSLNEEGQEILEGVRSSNLTIPSAFSFEKVCSSIDMKTRQTLLDNFYENVAPKVITVFQKARAHNKHVGIILGETHGKCKSILTEIALLNVLKQLQVETLFIEAPPKILPSLIKEVKTWEGPSKKISKEGHQAAISFINLAYAYAHQFPFIHAADSNRVLISPEEDVDNTPDFFMRGIKRLAHVGKNRECPDFRRRDQGMASTIKALTKKDFIFVTGHFHVSALKHLLKDVKKVLLTLSFSETNGESFKELITPNNLKIVSRVTTQDCAIAFKEDLLERIEEMRNDNPCVLHTLKPPLIKKDEKENDEDLSGAR
ncbi:MAG: hypothetical protein BGO77_08100 [Caedibacter sp. 37-49]|nr:MAG: hypothetical protein BGO77_08100 [Caedibacter sp. 37-49]